MFELFFVFVFISFLQAVQGEPDLSIMQHYNGNINLVISSVAASEGDNFILECVLMDNEKQLGGQTTWGKQTSQSDMVQGDKYLYFRSITPDDEGEYFCENSKHNLRRVISVTVAAADWLKPSCNNFISGDEL